MRNDRTPPYQLDDAINYYSMMMDTDPNGIFIYSAAGQLLECNEAACRMHGFSKAEMLKMAPKEFIHPDGYQTFLDFQKSLQRQGWFRGESAGLTKAGAKFEVEVYGRLITVNGVAYLYSTIRDITNDKENLRKLQEATTLLHATTARAQLATIAAEKAQEEAEEANRAKGNFLNHMSHELRTPIAAMLASVECLKYTKLDSEEKTELLETLYHNCNHLTKIIDDILDLSRVEAGKLTLNIEEVPIGVVLDEVNGMLAQAAQKKGVQLTCRDSKAPAIVLRSDGLVIRQILLNLLGNAIKFTEGGGQVWVESGLGGKPDELRILVKDTGCGIAAEDHARLFQSFTQADAPHSRKHMGSGLGLALSRKLAQALGGNVTLVTSVLGQGSTFQLSIPAAPPPMQGEPSPPAHAPEASLGARLAERPLAGRSILVVEDEEDIRATVTRLLSAAGAWTTGLENGQLALDLAGVQAFDAILMDMHLPVLDGLSTTRALRAHGYRGPILAVTAHCSKEEAARCLQSGCDAFISKPIDMMHLITVLQEKIRDA